MRRQAWRGLVVVVAAAALAVALWWVAEPSRTAAGNSEKRPPNVELFLVDDLGWTDLGCHGSVDFLRRTFLDPPREARPRGYWVWPHGNFDYTTIRKELEAYKAKGIGGVDIFDLGVKDSKDLIAPGPGFMSVEQVDGIAFALDEAKRLDLDMGLIVSSSWNAGGSWTPPEQAAMNLVAWRETVEGPASYERKLPFPELPESFKKSYGTFPLFVPKDENGLPKFFRDVTVLAYPIDGEGRVSHLNDVKILTGQVSEEGVLKCELPEGRWVVLRVVMTNFGQRLWLPSDNSQGLSIDHFSKEATRTHFETIIDRLEARVGPLEKTALERLYLASYESNAGVIWTAGFAAEFHARNGYRIEPFLPALFGTRVVDEETTERFLYDYRRTASELFLDNLYREASKVCHEHGLLLCSESGGPGAPLHDVPTEDLKALGAVDVMRGEFWVDKEDQSDADSLNVLQVVKQIASAAHIYGHPIVEMESFTSHLNWQEGPDVFKKFADRAFCEGMTRVVYHTMSHHLPEAGKPGWTYQAGSHMSTNLTWWDLSDQLHEYLARSSALLMQGEFVADVAYYYGHAIPNFAKPKHVRPTLGPGYDYDDLNTEVLLTANVDEEGRIMLPSGMKYRLLVLPENEMRMDLEVLRHLERLILQGATVLGARPERTYGLSGYPEDQRLLLELADRLWGKKADDQQGGPSKRYGRGRLIVGRAEREILAEMQVGPDFRVEPATLSGQVNYIHRKVGKDDVYFVRNAGEQEIRIDAFFRVEPRGPEIWDAVLGTMTRGGVYQETDSGVLLPLQLPAHGSVFVVFPAASTSVLPHVVRVEFQGKTVFPGQPERGIWFEAKREDDGRIAFSASEPGEYLLSFNDGQTRVARVEASGPDELRIEGPWEVRFPYGWKVPTRQVFETLVSWTDRGDEATRAFSGVATYSKLFEVPDQAIGRADQRVLLDLGEVREVARVYLNGREVGLSSFTPHVLDVTEVVRAGENSLVVDVANTWINRLIHDAALPESEQLSRTNLTLGQIVGKRGRDAGPKPSGLLGPVRLRFSRLATVAPPSQVEAGAR